MGYKVSERIDQTALDYDFAPYGPTGTTPQPRRDDLFEYQRAMAAALGLDLEGFNDEARAERMEKMSLKDQQDFQEALIEALANLCQGAPSAEEIRALPVVIFMDWQGYLWGYLNRQTTGPLAEPTTPSTKRSLEVVKNGA